MTTATTLIALATYNEIDNLPTLVDAILAAVPQADILIVDDNSPDDTGRWCDERARTEPRLHSLHRAAKLGLGSATITALRFASDRDYDFVATMDADWSHDPAHLSELLTATADADVVIGSRYCPGGLIDGWPLHRRALSRLMNGLTRLLLRLPVRDTSGAFRVYRVAKLQEIDLFAVKSSGYAYLEEILRLLDRAGARFAEVPITFHERRAGRSKTSLGVALDKFQTLARLAFSRRQS
jgi:dolichol-phosphate mannosyltransferase